MFCFNIRQHGRQILYFKLHVDGRKIHYRRPHAAVRVQVVHRCCRPVVSKVGGEAEMGDWGAVKQKWAVGGR